jgi:hypothetical protein
VLFVLPPIADDLDERTKDGLAVRNAATRSGVCPGCGARAEIVADLELPGLWHAIFRHEHDCPALTDEAAA